MSEKQTSHRDEGARPKWSKRCGSLGPRGESGAALIEFAIVAIPFLMLLFAAVEVGFVFWGMYDLESATEDAARQIRTGQVQAEAMDEDSFKAVLCGKVTLLSQCNTKLRLDVRSFTQFGEIGGNLPSPLNEIGELKDILDWQPGGAGAIVLVSAFYEWPLLNIVSSVSLSNMPSGGRLLRASTAFRNENWPEASLHGTQLELKP